MPIGERGVLDLADFSAANGSRFTAGEEGARLGAQVSVIGDINNDGFVDFALSADTADVNGLSDAGRVYVVFGTGNGFPQDIDLSALDGTNGFVLNGTVVQGYLGSSLSSAGDINGDGIADLLVGEVGGHVGELADAGNAYVIFGRSGSFDATIDLSSLNGSNGFVVNGLAAFDRLGGAVASLGDINGDGLDDVIVGAASADPGSISQAGSAYVIFGSTAGFDASFDLSALNGSNGFVIEGYQQTQHAASALGSAGDLNGDGFNDIVIGSQHFDHLPAAENGENVGEIYVVYGSSEGFSPTLRLNELNGTNGFSMRGFNAGDAIGAEVSSLGDINGDGFDDLAIDARSFGGIYVLYGAATLTDATFDIEQLARNGNGFVVTNIGPNDNKIAAVGDVNGDGLADFAVAAPSAHPLDRSTAGQTYIVFGTRAGFPSTFDLTTINGSNGIRIIGAETQERFGDALAGGVDLNGDGIDDLLVGATRADPNGAEDAGAVFAIFGSNVVHARGSTSSETLVGNSAADTLVGGGGDDTIDGGAGADVIFAGPSDDGDDQLMGGDGADEIGGAAGNDTLDGGTGNDTLYGAAGDDSISGGDGNDLIFNGAGADTVDGGAGNDTLWGGAGDDTLTGGDGMDKFIFRAGNGNDRIDDFAVLEDTIRLAGATTSFASAADVQAAATDQNGGVLIDLGGGDSLFITGLNISDIANITFEL